MMREIIDRLLEEKFERDDSIVTFSTDRIELNLKKNEVIEGSFELVISDSTYAPKGYITVSGEGMDCMVHEFHECSVTVPYRFQSKGLQDGDILQGEFVVISNKGEYYLPYVVSIEHTTVMSSLGAIKNLFHFTNLAKTNWTEAVQLFYTPEFSKIFDKSDKEYLATYILMSANPYNEQNVEEFLHIVNKKQPVSYSFSEDEVYIKNPAFQIDNGMMAMYSFSITKNGWGYSQLSIESSESFLSCDKMVLTNDDFSGNVATLNIFIDRRSLHQGKNTANLLIQTPYEKRIVPFTIHIAGEERASVNDRREKKRTEVELLTYYIAFRLHKISKDTWISESLPLVEKINALDEKNLLNRLFEAHLMIAEERFHEAKWILDYAEEQISKGFIEEEVVGYYLYLTTLYNRDKEFVDEVTTEIEQIFAKDESKWRIAWTLLFLRVELQESQTKRWIFMEEQFERKCFSPIIYVEALHLLIRTPAILMKLGEFEQQVLLFAMKQDMLTKEMMDQVHILISKNRAFSKKMFRVLCAYYDKSGDDDTLEAILTMLTRNQKIGQKYLKWYRLGIEKELRITRLYEHFMQSLDLSKPEPLPKMLLMYFAYHSDLDDDHNAYLYAYIVKFKNQHPEMFEAYHITIERFLVDQIEKGRINRDLAYLYHQMVSPAMLNEELAVKFIPLLFTNIIEVDNENIRKVILINEKTSGEFSFYVDHKEAFVPIYSKDYVIALEDKYGNRFMRGMEYELEKLLLPGKMAKIVDQFEPVHFGFDLFCCENNKNQSKMDSDLIQRFLRLSESDRITDEYRQKIRQNLMQYFFENDMVHELDQYLESLNADSMRQQERAEAIRYMILRGMYDLAYQWVYQYGMRLVDPKVLVRLCSRMISRGELTEDQFMTELTEYVFRNGKYDEFVLRYLVRYDTGMTRRLRDVWKAAESFEIDTQRIVERMLLQMMYTGSFVGEKMEIFRSYVRNGGNEDVEEAFLSFCAYDYFVQQKLEDDFVFEELLRHYHRGNQLNVVCRLAVLKYYSEHPQKRGSTENKDLESMLREMCQLQYYFPFFQSYTYLCPELKRYADHVVVEYRTNPSSKVIIHYMLERGDEIQAEFRKEEMHNMYGGIFQKSFSLFYGENLQYYITEVDDRKEQLTQSDCISKSEMSNEGEEGMFNLINDLVIANNHQDYDTADELLKEYYLAKNRMKSLFHMI